MFSGLGFQRLHSSRRQGFIKIRHLGFRSPTSRHSEAHDEYKKSLKEMQAADSEALNHATERMVRIERVVDALSSNIQHNTLYLQLTDCSSHASCKRLWDK